MGFEYNLHLLEIQYDWKALGDEVVSEIPSGPSTISRTDIQQNCCRRQQNGTPE
jgi:hypothetical protein